jgi:hypothetical protein
MKTNINICPFSAILFRCKKSSFISNLEDYNCTNNFGEHRICSFPGNYAIHNQIFFYYFRQQSDTKLCNGQKLFKLAHEPDQHFHYRQKYFSDADFQWQHG